MGHFILFIGPFFGVTELGYIALLFSAMYLPVTVITNSIRDVFREKANALYSQSGSCRNYSLKPNKSRHLGASIILTLYFIGPKLFPFLLGREWATVGVYAQIMIPMYYLNLVSMSFSEF